ncbi:MAG: hypothetical protein Q8S75_19690 [Nitrospirota bacterium]|nr:hypothetical protein [Nitrospirota bacterium]
MKSEMGRFRLTPGTRQALTSAQHRHASSEIDAITRRRTRRQIVTAPTATHESLADAFARQRRRDLPAC